MLAIRYGAKRIEFERGKDAIALKERKELLEVLPKLIAAVGAGELDAQMAALASRAPRVMRRT